MPRKVAPVIGKSTAGELTRIRLALELILGHEVKLDDEPDN